MTDNLAKPGQKGFSWRKSIIFIFGFILTVLGITLVIQQWDAVVLVFKAFIGAILAVLGLVVLFAASL